MGRLRQTALRVGLPATAVLAVALGAHAASGGGGGDRYRTATVASGAVEQRLVLTGVAQPTSRVVAAFPTSGLVTAVP